MMRFFVDLYEETMPASTVLFPRRTGPYGPDNAVLMEHFKVRLKEQRLYRADTVILAVPLDAPGQLSPRLAGTKSLKTRRRKSGLRRRVFYFCLALYAWMPRPSSSMERVSSAGLVT